MDSTTQPPLDGEHARKATVEHSQSSLRPKGDSLHSAHSTETQEEDPQNKSPVHMELRGGGRLRRNRVRGASHQGSSPPSSSHQVSDRTTPRNRGPPVLHLQGYFTDPGTNPRGPSYSFREVEPLVPQTEPRHRMVYEDYPGLPISTPLADAAVSTPLPQSFIHPSLINSQHGHLSTSRQFSSETSAISEPFSFYELPSESRRPSSEQNVHDQASFTQYDGTTASRPTSRGLYYSGRVSGRQAPNPSRHQPLTHLSAGGAFPVTSVSYRHGSHTPDLSMQITPRVPPRPEQSALLPGPRYEPYPGATHQFLSGSDLPLTMPGYYTNLDAATAAIQAVPSPLDPYSEHYQRLSGRPQSARPLTPSQPASNQYSMEGTRDIGPQQHVRGYQRANNESLGRRPNEQHPWQLSALAAPIILLISLQERHPQVGPTPSPAVTSHYAPVTGYAPLAGPHLQPPHHTRGSSSYAHRLLKGVQRSSENAPVRPSAQGSNPSGNSQVQIHRAAFERLHNAMQDTTLRNTGVIQQGLPRQNQPQLAVPHDTSNRPRAQAASQQLHSTSRETRRRIPQMSSNPPLNFEPSQSPQINDSTQPNNAGASAGLPSQAPLQGPRRRGGDAPGQAQVRSHQHVHPIAPATHLAPSRNYRSTSGTRDHASARSLRSPIGHVSASAQPPRRIPPQQRDQENSGAGEDQLMRREEAAIQARYSEDEQRDTMDETPPRVGPVERRMFS
ncbi:hypothetical protein GQ44DRAFT_707880 [Phaeosphaeriaceae sp. PMI808]|nr:hypothetical protein GQ44DRAFT_707880 [Phaeosphaeriaceae sp. PMI808]